jgi:hypothetical protein
MIRNSRKSRCQARLAEPLAYRRRMGLAEVDQRNSPSSILKMPQEEVAFSYHQEFKFEIVADCEHDGWILMPARNPRVDRRDFGFRQWLRSHHPLGFAVSIRRRSHDLVRLVMQNMARKWDADDPLLSLSAWTDGASRNGFSETLDLSGLFCARAALADSASTTEATKFGVLLANARDLSQAAKETPWQSLLPHPTLRSGIVLFRAENSKIARMPAGSLREHFFRRGVALTTYDRGLVRVSLPQTRRLPDETERFRAALAL